MKALVISETVSESAFASAHGMQFEIRRILIPEANNLVLTPYEDVFYVFILRETASYQVLREIDIPGELVEKAAAFTQLREELIETCAALINEEK